MESFANKASCHKLKVISHDGPFDGPFDVCIECSRRAVACSGPRTTAMPHERYVEWMKRLFNEWGGTRQELSDITGVSKSTIDDFFAGRRKEISRTTAGLLEDVLIGGDAKWPCAMLVDAEKEIVYEDCPEMLEALRFNMEANLQKDAQIRILQKQYDDAVTGAQREVQRIRAEYEEDIQEYKELVAHMRTQVDRKDDYIDRLAKKAGI